MNGEAADAGSYVESAVNNQDYQDNHMQDTNNWQDEQNNQGPADEGDYDRPVHLKEDG